MQLQEGKDPFKASTSGTVAAVFLTSLFLPFVTIRENRIAQEVVYRLLDLGLLPLVLLSIPPILVLLTRYVPALRYVVGPLGIATPLVILAIFVPALLGDHGSGSRYSVAFGMYLYLVAVLIFYMLSGKLTVIDLIGIASAIFLVVLVGLGGGFSRLGMFLEASLFGSRLTRELLAHMRITGISTAISVFIGLPVAFGAFLSRRFKATVFPVLNVLQTIPGIALFGLLIAPLAALSQAFPTLRAMGVKGIGNTPAIIALSLYALYPVIRYTFTTLNGIDEAVIQSARGMGMSVRQIWMIVRLPLAAPGMLHGIRVALVQTIGNATLAKLIGGDGLGVLVFEGLGQSSVDMVLLGMLMIVGLTVVADRLLQVLIFALTPIPLRRT